MYANVHVFNYGIQKLKVHYQVKEMSPREHGGGDEIHPGTVKMLHSRKARHAEIRHWIQRAGLFLKTHWHNSTQ